MRPGSWWNQIVIARLNWPIAEARPGDLVLLAGKGHEKTQTIGRRVIPFDDSAIASEVLRGRERSA